MSPFGTWVRVDEVENALHDSHPVDEDEHPAILKIKTMWELGQFDKIDRMVALFESFEAFGTLGRLLQRAVIWLAALLGAWWAISEYVVRYIRQAAGH